MLSIDQNQEYCLSLKYAGGSLWKIVKMNFIDDDWFIPENVYIDCDEKMEYKIQNGRIFLNLINNPNLRSLVSKIENDLKKDLKDKKHFLFNKQIIDDKDIDKRAFISSLKEGFRLVLTPNKSEDSTVLLNDNAYNKEVLIEKLSDTTFKNTFSKIKFQVDIVWLFEKKFGLTFRPISLYT